MVQLSDMIQVCDELTLNKQFKDFSEAHNGLQVSNNGTVTKVGAAVDASLETIEQAIDEKVDLLIVHHGLFWDTSIPITGAYYNKLNKLFTANIAVYSSHLPLDAHTTIGNNATIAKKLELPITDWVFPYEDNNIAALVSINCSREHLNARLNNLFPNSFKAIEFGSAHPKFAIISSGAGSSMLPNMIKYYGVDTLITGELKQHNWGQAYESKLNVYPCGHYATEVFGVHNLANKIAYEFSIPYIFLNSKCFI